MTRKQFKEVCIVAGLEETWNTEYYICYQIKIDNKNYNFYYNDDTKKVSVQINYITHIVRILDTDNLQLFKEKINEIFHNRK